MKVAMNYCIDTRYTLLCKFSSLYDIGKSIKLMFQDFRTPRTIVN